MSRKTINIPASQNPRFGRRVPIAINGAIAHVELDTDTEVSEEGLAVLDDGGVKYHVIGGEGSTATPDVGVASGVAYPSVANEVSPAEIGKDSPVMSEDAAPALGGNAPEIVAALEATGLADTDNAGFGGTKIGESEPTVGSGSDAAKTETTDADQTLSLVGADTTRGDLTESGNGEHQEPAGATEGSIEGDGDKGADDTTGGDQGGDDEKQQGYDLSLLDQSIPDLTTALAEVTDAGHIDALIEAETNGKSRSGAFSVLNDRKAALAE